MCASTSSKPFRIRIASRSANQLIPAGISIPSNIAEGSRRPTKAYLNHLSYSLGSHGEVETLFELIQRRKLVPEPLLSKGIVLIEPIGKMLHGLVESLEARLNERETLVTPVTALIPNPQSLIPSPNPNPAPTALVTALLGASLRRLRQASRRAAVRMRMRELLERGSTDHPADLRQVRRSAASLGRTLSGLFRNVFVLSRARRAIGEYEGTLREIIHALKYSGRLSLAPPLAERMRQRASELMERGRLCGARSTALASRVSKGIQSGTRARTASWPARRRRAPPPACNTRAGRIGSRPAPCQRRRCVRDAEAPVSRSRHSREKCVAD